MPQELKTIPLYGSHLVRWGAASNKSTVGIRNIKTANAGGIGGSFVLPYDMPDEVFSCAAYRFEYGSGSFTADICSLLRHILGFDTAPREQVLGYNDYISGDWIYQRYSTKTVGTFDLHLGGVFYGTFAFAPWSEEMIGGDMLSAAMAIGAERDMLSMAKDAFKIPIQVEELVWLGLYPREFETQTEYIAEFYDIDGNNVFTQGILGVYSELAASVSEYPRYMKHIPVWRLFQSKPANAVSAKVYQNGFKGVWYSFESCPKHDIRPRLHWLNPKGALDSITFCGSCTVTEQADSGKTIRAFSDGAISNKRNLRKLSGSTKLTMRVNVAGDDNYLRYVVPCGNSSAVWLELPTDSLPDENREQTILVPVIAKWATLPATLADGEPIRTGVLDIELDTRNVPE